MIDVATYFASVKITKEKAEEDFQLDNEKETFKSHQETLNISRLQKNVKTSNGAVPIKQVFSTWFFRALLSLSLSFSLSLSLS
jgi:hypothetical protein